MRASSSASLAMPFLALTAHPSIGAVLLDSRPAWVWNADGNRVLWTNAAGLTFFDETSISALLDRTFGDVHPARRHLARLARNARTNAPLLDRLRFFLGTRAVTTTCLCKRLEVEGEAVVLVLATDASDNQHGSLHDNAQKLVAAFEKEGDMQAALLDPKGKSLARSEKFQSIIADYQALDGLFAGADEAQGLATSTFEASAKSKDESSDKPTLLAGMARISHDDETHYLFLTAPDDDLSQPDYSAFDELDDYAHVPDGVDEIADIFDLGDGISYLPFARAEGPQHDIKPFVDDQVKETATGHRSDDAGSESDSHNPYTNVTSLRNRQTFLVPVASADTGGMDSKGEGSEGASESNIVNLSFGVKQSDDTMMPAARPVANAARAEESQSDHLEMSDPAEDERSDFDVHAAKKKHKSGSQGKKPKDKKKKKKDKKRDKFSFKASNGPYHFVWESDEVGRITYLSSDLEQAVGPKYAAIMGKTWTEIAQAFQMDLDGTVAAAFEERDTWSNLTVHWPIQDKDLRVPVEMTGLPVFGRFHGFQGFRGFGVCRTLDAVEDTNPPVGFALADDSPSNAPEGDRDDLMGADLLAAADHAVRAAEELVSSGSDEPSTIQDAAELVGDTSEPDSEAKELSETGQQDPKADQQGDGIMTVSDDQNNETKTERESSDRAARHAIEGEDQARNLAPEGYDLVASMMREEQERQEQKSNSEQSNDDAADISSSTQSDVPALEASEDIFDSATMASLSRGEQDAFDKIAQALNIPSSKRDNAEQPSVSGQSNVEISKQEQTEAAAKADPAPATEDENESEAKPAAATSEHDEALRSAASSAFRDIFAMDPAFRHMRERLSQMDKKESSSKKEAELTKSEHVEKQEPVKAFDSPTASNDADQSTTDEVVAKDTQANEETPRQTVDLFSQDRQTPIPFGLEDDEDEEDLSQATSESATPEQVVEQPKSDDAKDVAASTDDLTDHSDEQDGEAEDNLEPSKEDASDDNKVAATLGTVAAGITAIAGANALSDDASSDEETSDKEQEVAAKANEQGAMAALWDRSNKQSALIDLLNKLPTALIVSAGEDVPYASKAALRLLGHESAEALAKAGGMQSLFTGRPGDWLTKTDGRTTLRDAGGQPVSVNATISSINWGDEPAALLSFTEAPNEAPTIGLSEEDEKIAELEAILDTATDGVVVLDANASILRMNHSAEALFEVDRHEVAGSSFLNLLAEESHKDAIDYLDGLVANGVASVLNDGREVIGKVQSGGMIPLFMTLGRVAIPGTDRFCAVVRDIAQWKRAEEDLLAEKHRAQDASNQKSDFLAKVSHEIRTPLNAIIGFSEVMIDERFGEVGNERYKDYLKDIHTSGNHIMSLINDLLDLSKVEAGKMDLHFEATELNDLVSESVALMQPEANREQIIIRTSLSSKLPEVVGDTRSIKQIILNLLSNGVKYTPAGGQVIVSTAYEDNGEVVMRIRDTGIGMNEDEVQTALEPFRQVSNIRGAQQGTGLGLPLTKALVEANRARFSIVSAKDHGTMVEITFPNARVLAG